MATINVQAGVAAHVLPTRPEGGRRVPAGDQDREQGGPQELRAILNVLRQADDADLDPASSGHRSARGPHRGSPPGRAWRRAFTVTGDPAPLTAAWTWPPTGSSRNR